MTPPTEILKDALKALPPFEPPVDGWPRLQRALPALPRRRSHRLATGMALAASVLVAVAAALRLPPTQGPASAEDPAVAALMQQSRVLERDLARLRPRVAVWSADYATATQSIEDRLAVVDMQLNYAQAGGARRLWRDRVALLDSLVETHQAADLQLAPPANLTPDRPQPDAQTEWSL